MTRQASHNTPNRQNQWLRGAGFTIVELLIVVVVIAILAAITIVSYNGITNRAKNSAASSAAQQAAKKVLTYAALNTEQYPGSLSEAGVADGSATYQYRFNNDANPRTFCVTATTQNVSYFASSTETAPMAGACPGHGSNGGGTVTNLSTNPSGEDGTPSFDITGSGAGGSVVDSTTRADSGTHSSKFTYGSSGARGMMTPLFTVTPNTTYQFSISVFVEAGPTPLWIAADASYASAANFSTVGASYGWRRISIAYTTGASQTSLRAYATTSAAGVYYADSILLVAGANGSTSYADGDSLGWVWNGMANRSTSTGAPL